MSPDAQPRVELQELCTRISSGGTPSRSRPEYFVVEGGHPWVKSQELRDRPISRTAEQISDAGLENSSAKYYEADTVLVAMYGATVGKLGLLRVPATVNQAICALCVDPNVADYRYVYYALLASREDLVRQAAGAAQQNLNQGLIKQFAIPVLDLPAQRAIGAILAAYDDLLDRNRLRIAALQQMLRCVYREQFERHCAAPETTDGRREDLPEGWADRSLADLTSLISRGVAPRYDDNSPSLILNQRCIRDHLVSFENARNHSTVVPDRKYVRAGDVLINSTGVGTLGRVAPVRTTLDDVTVDSHVTVARPVPECEPAYFAQMMLSLEPIFESMGAGTTGQTELARGRVAEQRVSVAPPGDQVSFARVASPLNDLITVLVKQNEVVARRRDLLLPRLISGELSVPGSQPRRVVR